MCTKPRAGGQRPVLAPRNQTYCSQNRHEANPCRICCKVGTLSQYSPGYQQSRETLLYFSFTHSQLISWFYRERKHQSSSLPSPGKGWTDPLISLVALLSVFSLLPSICCLKYSNSLQSSNHFPFVHLSFVFPFLQILQQMRSLEGTKAFKDNVAILQENGFQIYHHKQS